MTAPLRAAIVGAGLMGRWHAHYAARAGAAVAAVVDRDPGAAAALQRRFPGARAFAELGDCLARSGVDVVHVCTPAESHVPLAALALAAGKHTLVEKPAAATAGEARELVALAARHGVLLTPVHQFPFQRGVRHVRRHLNRLGEPVRVAFIACTAGGEGLAGAERRRLLLDILPHPFSLFRALLGGEIERLDVGHFSLAEDELALRGALGGVRVEAFMSLRGRPIRNQLTVIGTGGTAHLDLYHGYGLIERGRVSRRAKLLQPFGYGGGLLLAAGTNGLRRATRGEYAYPGLAELVRRFYDAAAYGGPAPIDDEETVGVAALIDRLAGPGGRAAGR